MIVYVFAVALVLSIFTKRIKHVIQRNYKFFYLFPVPFVLQWIPQYREVWMPLSFAILVTLLILNKHIPGFKLMTVGTILNSFVMLINGWKMPVLRALADKYQLPVGMRHVLLDSFSAKLVLGDWIPIILPWKEVFIISVGDIFVYIGVFLFFLKIQKDK
ncbi:DUF5317 domain-containing protein [Thermosipho atlanticus]|uniref:DUF5317 domain-containing protein n=1 Tax=Thermosipho atlanticus DSM 15807 TaxID=1123380 RepID=A0A1M5TZV2_9BACT|nr:DUF5317 domain-containing protein [Thermosipho atlanticus]SHH55923.1 hypothetical protein SAMN02745199_1536 [Thermosipho atlanticus DSM 15807]